MLDHSNDLQQHHQIEYWANPIQTAGIQTASTIIAGMKGEM